MSPWIQRKKICGRAQLPLRRLWSVCLQWLVSHLRDCDACNAVLCTSSVADTLQQQSSSSEQLGNQL